MIQIDQVNKAIYEAHVTGMAIKLLDGNPCSICRKLAEDNIKNEGFTRLDLDEIHFHGGEFDICEKKLYLNYLNHTKFQFVDGQFLLDGHLHEASMLENIQAGMPDGWKIIIFKNNAEEIKQVANFKLVTHMDAMVIIDGKEYGLECKAVRDKNFKNYESGEIDTAWYGQTQSYMYSNNIECFYVIVKNRDTSVIHIPIKIELDMDYVISRIKKLKLVAEAITWYKNKVTIKQPDRRHSSSKEKECQLCPYKSICWS